jgi:ACS family glucarate transporter-like MFS transporter
MLTAFSVLSYVLRMNISIAQQTMAPELGLSDFQISQIFSAFMIAYAVFQVPAGIWGDRRGPRLVLTVTAVSWFVATLLSGLIPGWIATGTGAFLSLLALRFLLGASEAATYPVAARAMANWIPTSKRTFSNSLLFAGATAGSACTPPLMAWVMQRFGWRIAFYITALLPLVLAFEWWRRSRDTPEQHPDVSPDELALVKAGRPAGFASRDRSAWRALLTNWNVLMLCLSYFFDSYVVFIFLFWLFKYLVDVRKFSIAGGGWATSLPYLVASIMVPLLGLATDRLSLRLGILPGRRAMALGCQVCAGLLLFAGAKSADAWIAVAAISLSVGLLMSCEGPYWSTAVEVSGSHAGAVGGLLNMFGNLGGVASTSVVPVLVHYFGWTGALESGVLFVLAASVLWLLVAPHNLATNPSDANPSTSLSPGPA